VATFIKHNNENEVHEEVMQTTITVVRLMKEKFAVARITSEWLGWWDYLCVAETREGHISTQLISFILNVILQKHLTIISCSL
jgi:hypothetical protein